ncbi:hypothetical protein RJ640_030464 [Escallonia rubra]|uniref:RING-type E3 ubiquitin transferase n=1 Tax=Escallonia rubra TaxID=112253 RepID=A0AA88QDS5_9ASTE|nr:hypothetical protein RJ640_030464 [Escallonia rubra]
MQGQRSSNNSNTQTFHCKNVADTNSIELVQHDIVRVNVGQSSSSVTFENNFNFEPMSPYLAWGGNSSIFPETSEIGIDLNLPYDDNLESIDHDGRSVNKRKEPEGVFAPGGCISSTKQLEDSDWLASGSLNMGVAFNTSPLYVQSDERAPESFWRNVRPRVDHQAFTSESVPLFRTQLPAPWDIVEGSQSDPSAEVSVSPVPQHNLAREYTQNSDRPRNRSTSMTTRLTGNLREIQRRIRDEILMTRDEISNTRSLLTPPESQQVEADQRRVIAVSEAETATDGGELNEEPEEVEEEGGDFLADMRLDVDDMSYEDLLDLQEEIGAVSTGLSQEAISMRIRRHQYLSPLILGYQEDEESCSICLEVYIFGDELGKLDCGHDFHFNCIKPYQVLSQYKRLTDLHVPCLVISPRYMVFLDVGCWKAACGIISCV